MGTVFVVLWLLVWIASTAGRFVRSEAARPGDAGVLLLYGSLLLGWLALTSWIADRGGYVATTAWLGMDFAIAAPFALTLAFLVPRRSREAFSRWVASVSLHEAIWVHVVRLVGIGGILKMMSGELAAHFVIPVGIPDLLFGLSVPVLAVLASRSQVGRSGLIVWNALGALIFAPSMVLLFLSMPSPIQIYFDGPTTREVFEVPMALVPTFIAPVFMLVHLASIAKLVPRSSSSPA